MSRSSYFQKTQLIPVIVSALLAVALPIAARDLHPQASSTATSPSGLSTGPTDGAARLDCSRTYSDLDIDSNGLALTVTDYVELLKYVNGAIASIPNPFAADVNGDCFIDWADIYKLDTLMNTFGLCDMVPCPLPCACTAQPVRRCCWQTRGNVDNDINHLVDLSDLSYLVSYLTVGSAGWIKCFEAADINGVGIIDVSDLTQLVTYLTANPPPALPPCP